MARIASTPWSASFPDSPTGAVWVEPAPDLPRHIRAKNKLKLWREWWAEKLRRLKHRIF